MMRHPKPAHRYTAAKVAVFTVAATAVAATPALASLVMRQIEQWSSSNTNMKGS